jgi:hypothetical protein
MLSAEKTVTKDTSENMENIAESRPSQQMSA